MARFQPIGKRDLSRVKSGLCSPLGGVGDSCLYNINAAFINYLDGLVYKCPCVSGVTCVSSGFFIVPIGYSGTCTA